MGMIDESNGAVMWQVSCSGRDHLAAAARPCTYGEGRSNLLEGTCPNNTAEEDCVSASRGIKAGFELGESRPGAVAHGAVADGRAAIALK